MERDVFQTILSREFLLIFLLGVGLGSLIPAILTKVVMGAVFRHRTNFGLILLTMIATAFASMLAIAWLGLLDTRSLENLPPEPAILLTFASYMVQLGLLTAFVPDQDMESIAMWKWAVALILQYLLFIAIVVLIVLLFYFVAASAQAMV